MMTMSAMPGALLAQGATGRTPGGCAHGGLVGGAASLLTRSPYPRRAFCSSPVIAKSVPNASPRGPATWGHLSGRTAGRVAEAAQLFCSRFLPVCLYGHCVYKMV